MREISVEDELVVVLDVFSARNFLEDASLSAGQRLQRATELRVFNVGHVLQLGQRERVAGVEGEQAERLEERDLQLFGGRVELSLEDGVAEVGLPLELSTGVLCVVKFGEDVLIFYQI